MNSRPPRRLWLRWLPQPRENRRSPPPRAFTAFPPDAVTGRAHIPLRKPQTTAKCNSPTAAWVNAASFLETRGPNQHTSRLSRATAKSPADARNAVGESSSQARAKPLSQLTTIVRHYGAPFKISVETARRPRCSSHAEPAVIGLFVRGSSIGRSGDGPAPASRFAGQACRSRRPTRSESGQDRETTGRGSNATCHAIGLPRDCVRTVS